MELDVQRFLACNKDPAVLRLEDAYQVICEIQTEAREELLQRLESQKEIKEFDFRLCEKKSYEIMDLIVACATLMPYVWKKRSEKVSELYGKQEDRGSDKGTV